MIMKLFIAFILGAIFTLALVGLHAVRSKDSYCKCYDSDYEVDKYIP